MKPTDEDVAWCLSWARYLDRTSGATIEDQARSILTEMNRRLIERLAKEAEQGIMVRAQISSEEFVAAEAGQDMADWLRSHIGNEHD